MFCSAVSWTLSFWDMLFARVLCELKGKRHSLAAAPRLFCISVPLQAGAPGNCRRWQETGGTPGALCSLGLWVSYALVFLAGG